MSDIRYTKDHEYILPEADGIVRVGISDYAQSQLGDVVFVDLPKVGSVFAQQAQAAVVESVKAASDIYAPVAGQIVEINEILENAPGKINEDPLGEGWIMKIKIADPKTLEALLDEAQYQAFLKTLS